MAIRAMRTGCTVISFVLKTIQNTETEMLLSSWDYMVVIEIYVLALDKDGGL